MSKTYIKVLTHDLTSFVAAGKAEVTYKLGKFVEAPQSFAERGYHLLVFDSLKHAKEYSWDCFNKFTDHIFECECRYRISPLPPICNFMDIDDGELNLPDSFDSNKWPKGTRMFKEVKLLKEIRW